MASVAKRAVVESLPQAAVGRWSVGGLREGLDRPDLLACVELDKAGNPSLLALVPQGPHPGQVLALSLALVPWVIQN